MAQHHMIGRGGGRTARIAVVAATTAVIACCHVSLARAGDTDDGQSFTDKFLSTLGLRNLGSTEYEINYSERSPLVVPPNRSLPPPIAGGPPPTPNWPKDPDVTRRKAEKSADSNQGPHVDWVTENSRALRPDELNVPGPAAKVAPPGTPEQSSPPPSAKKSIFSFDWAKKTDYATFTGEPARASLTDPPPGYLTPSPDQPYGIGPERAHYHVPTASDHGEPQR